MPLPALLLLPALPRNHHHHPLRPFKPRESLCRSVLRIVKKGCEDKQANKQYQLPFTAAEGPCIACQRVRWR
jgi:hypothetical protein